MPADSIAESYKSPVIEASRPAEKISALKTNVEQILNNSDDQSPQETFQKLSLLETTEKDSKENPPTIDSQPEKVVNTTTQDQVEVDRIMEDIEKITTDQGELPNSTDSDNQILTTKTDLTTSNSGLVEIIKNRYAKKQQEKVDKYLKLFFDDLGSIPSEEGLFETKPLSLYKQVGRIILDYPINKIIFSRLYQKSHQQQEKEAENIAATKYYQEVNMIIKAEREAEKTRLKAKREAEITAQINKTAKDAKIEKEKFEQDLLQGMEDYREEKVTKRKKERVQEITERALNERLTNLEEIEAASSIEGSGVAKRQIDYIDENWNEKSYIIYDMQGYPFRFLQHGINYKYDPNRVISDQQPWRGTQTAKDLMDNPSLWTKPRDSVGKLGGKNRNDTKSNVICTSYINTKTSLNSWGNQLISYGFESVLPGSILDIGSGDLQTHSYLNEEEMVKFSDQLYTPEKLEQSDAFYNEVVLKRYNREGKPQLPNFLIVKDLFMNQERLNIIRRHAVYFNIPIINIETQYYKSKK